MSVSEIGIISVIAIMLRSVFTLSHNTLILQYKSYRFFKLSLFLPSGNCYSFKSLSLRAHWHVIVGIQKGPVIWDINYLLVMHFLFNFRLSCSGWSDLLTCPVSPVQANLPDRHVQADLFRLSCPVQCLPSRLYFPGCPATVVLS